MLLTHALQEGLVTHCKLVGASREFEKEFENLEVFKHKAQHLKNDELVDSNSWC